MYFGLAARHTCSTRWLSRYGTQTTATFQCRVQEYSQRYRPMPTCLNRSSEYPKPNIQCIRLVLVYCSLSLEHGPACKTSDKGN
jgi:hypothetical protein